MAGCPKLLRADNGTENSIISVIQCILRHHHSDNLSGQKSFIYGRSVNNQVYDIPEVRLFKHFFISV